MDYKKNSALDYHSQGRPGKIEVIPTKPYSTQRDLSLAYSPGVAEPCLEIHKNPEDAYKYTAKGNLVAVISNGTAVLGLGDIGPLASKPVMEGKGMLFKIYADIDVFDIEVNTKNIDEFVNTVKNIAPTFGGINLEDIKAPECFEIEKRLKEILDIPVMHDDQHGTAIISTAALMNACEIFDKDLSKIKMVINGAGASAISCAKMYISIGVKKENIVMLDSKGVIHKNRKDLDEYKSFFATDRTDIQTLAEAINGADVFVGLSKGNVLSKEMVQSMAKNCIVFALANPTPEISYEEAISAREDIIVATGRSDTPNQVNNVLGYPYIFRGALDVQAKQINEAMKIAAAKALAALAKEQVPDSVLLAYGKKTMVFGKDYIIPKPLDPRLISEVSSAVAKAAIESGVARKTISDFEAYKIHLANRIGKDNKFIRTITQRAKLEPKKIVFAEADALRIIKAVKVICDENIAQPILLGNKNQILAIAKECGVELGNNITIIDPMEETKLREEYGDILWKKRQRKGLTQYEARRLMRDRNYFGAMMVELGHADAMISGITRRFNEILKPALEIIGPDEHFHRVAGLYALSTKKGIYFFADATIHENPTWEQLVDITLLTHNYIRQFNIQPVIAMLSYSNFGSVKNEETIKQQKAIEYLHKNHPDIIVDGEIQPSFALNQNLLHEKFPFSKIVDKEVNTFIFPNLSSAHITQQMLAELGNAEIFGPILMGLKKPVHVLQLTSTVREIVNMAVISVLDAQSKKDFKIPQFTSSI
ncbi:MAG TPA: NADP-dependent malic enzyme [Bacteroidia bacterium]|nr:NADP-dependent malic enzyme [Bacteroidia bacterium]